MKIVQKDSGLQAPGWCVFTHDIDGPFLDTERWINEVDPRGYVQVSFVEEMGRAVGMISRSEVEAIQEQLSEAQAELASLKDLLERVEIVRELEEAVA